MERKIVFSLILFALVFTGCLPDEEPVPPVDRGGKSTITIEMLPTYDLQTWFNLSSKKVVKTAERDRWEIQVSLSGTSSLIVQLNTAIVAQLAKTNSDVLANVDDSEGLIFKVDDPSGNLDSTAMGKLGFEYGVVYVLDAGYSSSGQPRGTFKFQIVQNNDRLELNYARLDEPEFRVVQIPDSGFYFSMTTNRTVSDLPSPNDYDLVFTNYTHIFYTPYQPYSVTGVLATGTGVEVAVDSNDAFVNVTASSIKNINFSKADDAIGYAWKSFDLETGTFTVDTRLTYVVKDRFGYYHKLRFIDFYNESGEKGYPVFELEALN